MNYENYILFGYIIYLIIMSIIAFILFIKDKRLAKNGSIRIKERTLLGISVFGGAIGAFFGRIVAHHKTNKVYFSIVIYLSILFNLLILTFAMYMAYGRR